MRSRIVVFVTTLCALLPATRAQADRFVALDGPHEYPYDSWGKAATNIQAALTEAAPGETVWVSNGTFTISATLGLDKGVALRGMGPEQTAIRGMGAPTNRLIRVLHPDALLTDLTVKGPSAQGALYVLSGTVSNCWVIQHTMNLYQRNGAGLEQAGGLVTHCLIAWNTNAYPGSASGGAILTGGVLQNSVIASNSVQGTSGGVRLNAKAIVRNCLILGNTATGQGGGAYLAHAGAVLENCTVTENRSAPEGAGGGLYKTAGSVTNSIISGNWRGPFVQDIDGTAGGTNLIAFSCAPELDAGPFGNIKANPLFAGQPAGDFRLGPGSPCLDSGTNATWTADPALDLAGQPRRQDGDNDTVAVTDMGCYERGEVGSGPLQISFAAEPHQGYVSVQTVFTAHADGADSAVTWYGWDFQADGTNDRHGPGLAVVTNTFTPGLYNVLLTVSNASSETASSLRAPCVKVDALEYFVATNGAHMPPYDSWEKAATNLRTAAEYARADGTTGVTIRVGAGLFTETASVVLWQPVQVIADQGPSNTAVRWLSASAQTINLQHAGALLSGLTVKDNRIGGVLLSAGVVSNCWLIHNTPYSHWMNGGGVRMSGGLVTDSIIAWNTNSTANNLGAGAYMTGGLIQNSLIVSNTARSGSGGGVHIAGAGTVRNCLLAGNNTTQTTGGNGGGAALVHAGALLESCTVADNACPIERDGGGVYKTAGTVSNSVIYANLKGVTPQNLYGTNRTFHSCAPELAAGPFGNTPLDPRFTAGYHLDIGSPCRDSGTNAPWMENAMDLAGQPRIANDIVDMGCYEALEAGAGPLQVSFSAEPALGYLTVTSVLTAAAGGQDTNLTHFAWDFDNDGIADLAGADLWTVTNAFPLGFHTVALTVSNASLETAGAIMTNLVRVYPDAYFVATNGGHVIPFDSPAKAATNIADVLDYALADGTRDVLVTVAAGEYPVPAPLVLSRRIRLAAPAGPEATRLRATAGLSDRLVKISHAQALFTGFTVSGGNYGGVLLQNGTVSNCWLVHNTPFTHWIYGGGLEMSGGLATHCLIGWNTNSTVNNHSAGVYMTGGLLTHSVIRNNQARSGSAGGIGVGNSAATVRNCLVFDNESVQSAGGGIYLTGGRVENVTAVSNRAATAGGGLYLAAPLGAVTNTIAWSNLAAGEPDDVAGASGFLARCGYSCAPELDGSANGNLAADPLFRDATTGNLRLQPLSPCRNAGTNLAWMAVANDLDGSPRIRENRADMGAYERAAMPGVFLFIR